MASKHSRPRVPAHGRRARGVTYEAVRKIALALPGVEEGLCYGTPALRVKGKLLVRLKEDGETIVLRMDFPDREFLLQADPRVFFLTDHYVNSPALLVRLPAVRHAQLDELLERAWRFAAPRRLVETREGRAPASPERPVPRAGGLDAVRERTARRGAR